MTAAKFPVFFFFLGVLCGTLTADAAMLERGTHSQNPVSYVVELLKDLSKQVTTEGKAEQDMYEKFVCWAKTIIDAKTETNTAAQQRIGVLETYISDIDNGRIEFTSERVDLEKEIKDLNGDIEAATTMRNKENSDYEQAKDEMDKAIDALQEARTVLQDATRNHTQGSLLLLKAELHEGAELRVREAAMLNRAVHLGERFLTKGDAVFLRRILTGEVPRADWKKLNRKATFKLGYKARSFKIQGVLAELLETFRANLADAITKEGDSQALFDKLVGSKGSQKTAAQEALTRLDKEKGAASMSRSEAEEEVNDLTEQVTNDDRYIGQVKQSLADKKAEWVARQKLRADELAAIAKAIDILHNDDARDLFKKSFASQGVMLVQVSRSTSTQLRSSVVERLRRVARTSLDRRLLAIANRVASGSHFDQVIQAIDTMIGVLNTEETDDLQTKEQCEAGRLDNTRKAALASRAMDEFSDTMASLTTKIDQLSEQIATAEEEVDTLTKEMAEAKRLRDEEEAAYKVSKKEDEDASQIVADATTVLRKFYTDNNLMFAQQPRQAGKAPPPPPTTWENPQYGGKTGESTGILAILEMVKEDIDKDVAKAIADEAAAVTLYDTTKGENNAEKTDLHNLIGSLNTTRSESTSELTTASGDRLTKKGELEGHLSNIAQAEPGCNFFVINYHVRRNNRHIEIDGLQKAKAILRGATFDPLDEDRELKPGDALLQRRMLKISAAKRA